MPDAVLQVANRSKQRLISLTFTYKIM